MAVSHEEFLEYYLENYDLFTYPGASMPDLDQKQLKSLLRKSTKIARSEKERSRVYFIEADGVAIKIGFTLDVERRIKRMQMDCPIDLYLIGVMKGDRNLEAKIHRKFKKYRYRGEWFKISDDIIKYAKANSINLKKSYKLKKFCRP